MRVLLLKSRTGPVTACKANEENMIFNWSQTVSKVYKNTISLVFNHAILAKKNLFFLVTFWHEIKHVYRVQKDKRQHFIWTLNMGFKIKFRNIFIVPKSTFDIYFRYVFMFPSFMLQSVWIPLAIAPPMSNWWMMTFDQSSVIFSCLWYVRTKNWFNYLSGIFVAN